MNREERKELFEKLSKPFPEDAIERTKGAVTRKGYDTTGIKYQYIVNRFNDVLGVGGFLAEPTIAIRETKTQKGRAMFDAVCDLTLKLGEWTDTGFVPFAQACGTGGHSSLTEADAKKGAFTNAFKKVAAMFGCGWQAYAGTIDDDSEPPGYDEDDARAAYENGRRNQRPQQNQQPAQTTLGQVKAAIYNAGNLGELGVAAEIAAKLPPADKAAARDLYSVRLKELKAETGSNVGTSDDGPQEKPRRREPGDDDGPAPGDPGWEEPPPY